MFNAVDYTPEVREELSQVISTRARPILSCQGMDQPGRGDPEPIQVEAAIWTG
jgi:hypothetical protein